jgi:hypothetical protein
MRCISIVRSSYIGIFSASFLIKFLSPEIATSINLLKPTGYVMHHQFNIQQLYALPTLYSCVLYLS